MILGDQWAGSKDPGIARHSATDVRRSRFRDPGRPGAWSSASWVRWLGATWCCPSGGCRRRARQGHAGDSQLSHGDRGRASDQHQHEPLHPGSCHLPARAHRVARTLSTWSIGYQACIAILTALDGMLAASTSPRTALTVAVLIALVSSALLPRRDSLTQATSRYPLTAPRPSRREVSLCSVRGWKVCPSASVYPVDANDAITTVHKHFI